MAIRHLLKNHQLKLQQTNLYKYHYKTSGRALMGNTDEQPEPTEYYNYHYVPDNYPDALCGIRYPHRDPFEVQQVFGYETWEYQYEGQWWDIGSLTSHLIWFTSPFWLYFIYQYENKKNVKRRGNQNTNYHTQNGFYQGQLYLYDEEPIIDINAIKQ